MKKIGMTLMLIAMLLCTVLVGAPAVQAEETEPVHTDHCVCGGGAVEVHETHGCEVVTWQPLPEGTVDFATLDGGNYYLTGDVGITAASTDIQGKTLSICLNGHNITTTAARVFGRYLQTGTTLNLCDCSYDAEAGTWAGTVTGGKSTFGTIIWADDGAEVNIFGGNLVGSGHHARKGGLLYASGKTLDEKYTGASELNIYNGVISGGKAGQGGNIFANCKSVVNMYGGTVTGGKASYISWSGGNANGQGGNIMIDSTATMNLYGGKIENGEAVVNGNGANRGCGGNMAISGIFNMYGGEVSNGKASTNTVAKYSSSDSTVYDAYTYGTSGCGGNIVTFWSTARINIHGGSIYGGEANGLYGGNIYLNATSPQLNIYGGKIWGGVANADKDEANTEALCFGSDVKGGSISIVKGKLTMTGGSIGIDASGNAAGGSVYPADAIGGNIYLSANATTASIEGGTIANGTATSGGNIYSESAALSISNAAVASGKATNEAGVLSYGGNIYSKAALTITNANITDGIACHGGNVIQYGSTLNITDSTVSGGHADLVLDGKTNGNGGNVYVDSKCVCTITNSTIENGSARRGGNLAALAAVTVSGGTISGGSAVNGGGNIFVYGANGSLTLEGGCGISDGTANNGGNVLVSSNGTAAANNVIFTGGTATAASGNGGSIYVGGGSMTMTDSIVAGGDAYNGGALCVANGTFLTVTDSVVSTTTGSRGRAAYVAKGGTLTVQDSELNNTVTNENSGTCIWNCGTLVLVGTVKLNNAETVTIDTSDIMVDGRNESGAYIDVTGLTGQDAPYLFRRWETVVDGVTDDCAGMFATGATEAQAAMFDPWNNAFYVTCVDGQLILNVGGAQTRGADGAFIRTYESLAAAMADTDENITWYRLLADQDGVTVSKDMIIDLYGFDLTDLTIAEGVTLTGMDTTTDDYDCTDGYGTVILSAENKGAVTQLVKTSTDRIGSIKRYMTVNEDGVLSFHRFYVGITKINLKPGVTGIGYKATFAGDAKVLEQLNADEAYGYTLWLGEDGQKVSRTGNLEQFDSNNKEVTLRLQNFDVAGYSTTSVNAQVFLKLKDGTVISSAAYSCTFKNTVEAVAQNVNSYTDVQMTALQTMCTKYADAMKDWNIDSIRNWVAAEEK